jgi:hypothetical protein
MTLLSDRTKKVLVFFLAATALSLANCSSVSRFVESSKNPYRTKAYKAIRDKWSREARIHQGLEVELIISATFKSKAFRRAYADEYGEAYKLSPEEKTQFVKDQLQAADLSHEFVVASFVPEKKWDEFDKPQSIWKLYLVNDRGERVQPLEVQKPKQRDAKASYFFPYVTPWKTVYVVRFPSSIPETDQPLVGKHTKAITLVITSVLGTTEMDWNLE